MQADHNLGLDDLQKQTMAIFRWMTVAQCDSNNKRRCLDLKEADDEF
jgi:hypothetical protein